jgi:peptidoglycan/LPS O-acetylase OafA/YrhL
MENQRFQNLDALRGIAALNVVFAHYTNMYDRMYGYDFKIFNWEVGSRAVELFFILSGFVIFYSVQNIKSPEQFLKKRFVRLYPAFWVCLSITLLFVVVLGLPKFDVTFREKILNYSMLPQIFGARKVDLSYWTLVPEFFFYLLIYFLLKIKKIDKVMYLLPVLLITSIIHQFVYHIRFFGLFLNLDYIFLFASGIIFYQLKFKSKHWYNWLLLIVCYGVACASYGFKDYTSIFAITLIYALFATVVFKEIKLLNHSVFNFFGKISYPLYLLHSTVGYIIINHTLKYINNPYVIVLPIIVSIILASIVSYLIEPKLITWFKQKLKV